MNARTRMLALRAAAKVTVAGSLFGCEKAPMVTAETTRTSTTGADAAAPPPTVAPLPSAPPAPTTCNVGVGDPTEADVACCRALVHTAVSNAQKLTQPDQVACCAALAKHNDIEKKSTGSQDMPDRYACCEAVRWQGSFTCTPWGPPVPPEIDWVA